MPQHDYVIDNQLFPATRTDFNNALLAIATQNSGSTAPATPYSGMWWLDTSTTPATQRQRNAGNTAWVEMWRADTTNGGLATLASPTFTGTPAAPTAAATTNTTQIATTAFVQAAQAVVPSWTNATLVNSWSNFGAPYTVLRYRKYPNGDVAIQGVIQKTTSNAANETILTLPAGSRPGDALGILCPAGISAGNSPSNVAVTISTAGVVQIVGANTAPNFVNFMQIFAIFKGEN